MSAPFWTPGFTSPAVLPADIEWLAIYFLTPYMGSTPIATRLPNPKEEADTINGFLRVESGGGTKCNVTEWDLTCILHGYSPNEIQARQICATALTYMSAARGQSVSGWSVTGVPHCTGLQRLSDPNVAKLTRYRAMVTWRVPGQLMNPGS